MNPDTDNSNDDLPEVSEIDALKARADMLGVTYHPSIGLEKLRAKVNAAVTAEPDEGATDEPVVEANKAPTESENKRRLRLRQEANALVRVRISCMNPAKKEHEGEIFSIGNSLIGTITRYVPYNADDGWHVERAILNMIQDRQCQIFVTTRDERGNQTRRGKLIKEFGIEIMPDLTQDELDELAQRQAMAKSVG